MKKILLATLLSLTPTMSDAKTNDKIKHILFSSNIGIYTAELGEREVAYATCIGATSSKEIIDTYSKGTPDTKDILANFVGCSIGIEISNYFRNIHLSFSEEHLNFNYIYKF
ncbi:hypothetical protein [Photobacterium leiognathi]|uniref:hypothetical protein n=1 Tax=Photobacterium leiognathi TaxID=553611 RepID=UPI002981D9B9|nr:hypothetical protein [Photobacterium leiognathi]